MRKQNFPHIDLPRTAPLRNAYVRLVELGRADPAFTVEHREWHHQHVVTFRIRGYKKLYFECTVNTGSRVGYHLFYLKHPMRGNVALARSKMGASQVRQRSDGEITIQIRNVRDAERVWRLVRRLRRDI